MAGLIDGNYFTTINALAQRGTLIVIWIFVSIAMCQLTTS
jgi:hypothetical protein